MNRDTRPIPLADLAVVEYESTMIAARAELLSVRCETEITDADIASLFEDVEA